MSMSKSRSKAPELLTDLSEQVSHALVELLKQDKERADQVGREVAERIASHWGGQNIYVPMGQSIRLSRRDLQVYNDFNGSNHSDLARKYSISLVWVYKIIKAVRKEEIAKRQGDMFGPMDD